MRRRMASLLLLLGTLIGLSACNGANGNGERTVLLVSAAASLKISMEQIAQDYERANTGIDIQLNFGSSGTLQQQIEQGAPADLFLSAGRRQMDALREKGLIRESRDVLSNELVLVIRTDYAGGVTDAGRLLDAGLQHIAVGEPDSVPAGMYARQALTSLGLWDKLSSKLVYGKDVRQVLAFVETGNADAGIVYRTDVQPGNAVTLALVFPPDAHDPIVYPFGVTAQTRHPEEARAFFEYLQSEEAGKVFRSHGFRQP